MKSFSISLKQLTISAGLMAPLLMASIASAQGMDSAVAPTPSAIPVVAAPKAPVDTASEKPMAPPAGAVADQATDAPTDAAAPAKRGKATVKKDDFSAYGFKSPSQRRRTSFDASRDAEETGSVVDRSAARRRGVARKLPKKNVDKSRLAGQANTELVIQPEDRSSNVVVSSATVSSKVDQVENPIDHPQFSVELSLQPYTPKGRAQLTGTQPQTLEATNAPPMPALDLRWVPLSFEAAPLYHFGLFGSVGYIQNTIKISTPTGASVDDAKLNTMKTQFGLAGDWSRDPKSRWNLRAQLGGGVMNAVQSSASSYANGSTSLGFYSAGLFFEYQIIDRVAVSVGYDYRAASGTETPDLLIQKNNFILGVSGGFQ